jgi:hypothetical protein
MHPLLRFGIWFSAILIGIIAALLVSTMGMAWAQGVILLAFALVPVLSVAVYPSQPLVYGFLGLSILTVSLVVIYLMVGPTTQQGLDSSGVGQVFLIAFAVPSIAVLLLLLLAFVAKRVRNRREGTPAAEQTRPD